MADCGYVSVPYSELHYTVCYGQHSDIQYDESQYNDTQHNGTHRSDMQLNAMQHNNTTVSLRIMGPSGCAECLASPMLSVTNEIYTPSVIMLNVIMLSVVVPFLCHQYIFHCIGIT
jgi:hypothetical protein